MFNIWNYVYDCFFYGIKFYIDIFDLVFCWGVGFCGEYVGVLLVLVCLNGIVCCIVGCYKCLFYFFQCNLFMELDFNYVWFEFYLFGIGWLFMEFNFDDINDGGLYFICFFMGLVWYYVEIVKDVFFE